MCVQRLRRAVALYLCLAVCLPATAWSQETSTGFPSIIHKVEGTSDRVEMTVNSSRILTLGKKIPKVQINNKELVDVTPVGANQVQLFAKKPGVTQVNLWDDANEIHAIDVVVFGDSRELSMTLQSQFPGSSVKVLPTSTSVILSGYVDKPEDVTRIVEIAKDYYPKVINNINVGGAQQVLLFVKVIEVSRTKLRDFGFDWVSVSGADYIAQSVSGLIRATGGGPLASTGTGSLVFGAVGDNSAFFGVLQALQEENIAKTLSEPTLVAYSGRPAYFESGGDIPIPVIGALGVQGIDYRPYGTRVDFVPIVLGNGKIRLEVRPRVSEIDPTHSVTINGEQALAFTRRTVDTGVEMSAGQTLALAGILYNKDDGRRVGIPLLMDVPLLGAAFGRNRRETNEIELLVLVRPEFASPIDACDMPSCGPGMSSEVPSDCDLYINRHIEVPVGYGERHGHGRDCATGDGNVMPQPSTEQLPPGEPVMINDQAVRRMPSRPVTKSTLPPARSSSQIASKPRSSSAFSSKSKVDVETPEKSATAKSTAKKATTKPKADVAKTTPSSPAKTDTTTRSRAKSSSPSKPSQAATANDQTPGPAFIGPTGYDVLN